MRRDLLFRRAREAGTPRRSSARMRADDVNQATSLMSANDPSSMGKECARSIGDYAIIGDCRSAALISREGSLDWLCLPHFSSPSIFGALLDQERGGRFLITPVASALTSRRYLPGTNVLETTFRTADGVVRLTDVMTIPCGPTLQPMREVLRLVEGLEGAVPVRVDIELRPDYGRTAAHYGHAPGRTNAFTSPLT
jgi:GH15 family glucan-1,4-alpha-glucosidase